MLNIPRSNVWGFQYAILGMRNPLNSWQKSDSDFSRDVIGEKDMELCKKLIASGSEHRKFLRMIHVQVDVNAPLYWWKEYDTYKVGTVANSCSTMHTIHKYAFSSLMFSSEHLESEESKELFEKTIDTLNLLRVKYLNTKDKETWYEMIQLLPSSFMQIRTLDLNYETLITMYKQRKNHKLHEWYIFCSWIEMLPYMKEFLDA